MLFCYFYFLFFCWPADFLWFSPLYFIWKDFCVIRSLCYIVIYFFFLRCSIEISILYILNSNDSAKSKLALIIILQQYRAATAAAAFESHTNSFENDTISIWLSGDFKWCNGFRPNISEWKVCIWLLSPLVLTPICCYATDAVVKRFDQNLIKTIFLAAIIY